MSSTLRPLFLWLLITQLAVLLEQRASQHRFPRQALAAGPLDPMPAQVPRYQVQQIAMLVQPLRHRAELTADLGGQLRSYQFLIYV
ncbi:hypothetical protein MEA186_02834 [Mesorhizobium amorphae CCNWGS0123]|uniref:Uncharacterized protein n=1 Tax=Mesorhizobium amorphae CCNWGS0123 TaxID=1082933 RepID=G6Y3R4_9HYPH|nr:hypothetical protein A6B35_33755 [Mesorhizobium amorphae CCNWGS0123]EHH13610.1 hypothetical protein MEA186_02834 [Mesorhizobium amorphae CCNWGS0123]